MDSNSWSTASYGHTDIVKILAQLTDNPNAPDNDRDTPIHEAAKNGHTEIVKILAHLTDNPNAPIFVAALRGHTEIVKILTSLTETQKYFINSLTFK